MSSHRRSILPLAAVFGLSLLGACVPGANNPIESHAAGDAPPKLADRDPALACKLVREQKALLLDVRSDAEFAEAHLDGATHIPHDQLSARIEEVGDDKDRPIVTYCRSGRRADAAKQILVDAGYTQVTNLGGMSSWELGC